MINFLLWYLSVGSAIYITFFTHDALNGFKKFHNANLYSVLRGVLFIFVWPLLPWAVNGERK